MILSIITINLNNTLGLYRTIVSVINQDFTDFEYIIIDGGSTDDSVDIIKEYANKITYWVSEPDKGIYNAMNKGILKANGEYSLFLNSGDSLYDSGILQNVSQYLTGKFDLVCGSSCHWRNEKLNVKYPLENLRMSNIYRKTLPHQACFIKKSLFYEVGFYNEENKIVSDWEFFVKCAKRGVSYLPIKQIITLMEPPELSSKYSLIYPLHIKEREDRKSVLFENYIDDLDELFLLRERKLNTTFTRILRLFHFKKLKSLFRNFS